MSGAERIASTLLAFLAVKGPDEPGPLIDRVSRHLRLERDRVVGALWTLIEEGQIEMLPDRRVRRAG